MGEVTKDYNLFDCHAYLDTYFKDPQMEPRVLRNLHKFWSQRETNLKLLEFGGGPNISRLISACPHVQGIVFTEYMQPMRQTVQAWIDKEANAFDWRANFDFIVRELEGKATNKVAEREEELREKIRAVIPCDVTAEKLLEIPPHISAEYSPPFDVVSTSYCLEAVVESREEYQNCVTKLAKLVTPGGYLVMHGAIDQSFYTVGTKKFYSFRLTKEMIVESMEKAGIKNIQVDLASSDTGSRLDYLPLADMTDEFFVYGQAAQ